MKVKTSELSGVQLDYAVAYSVDWGQPVLHITSGGSFVELMGVVFSPTTNWSQCGPLIDAHSPVITICRGMVRTEIATLENDVSATGIGIGITYTISFCRALVSLKLGDEVDIPDELMEVGE